MEIDPNFPTGKSFFKGKWHKGHQMNFEIMRDVENFEKDAEKLWDWENSQHVKGNWWMKITVKENSFPLKAKIINSTS